jgi:MFS family permease
MQHTLPEGRGEHHREMLVPLDLRTYRLAIANGVIGMAGIRMADEATVLPLLVLRLSGLAWVVGLMQGLSALGRTLVQVFLARWLDTIQYKLPVYVASTFVRGSSLLIAAAALMLSQRLGLTSVLVIVIASLTLRSAGGALAMLGFTDVVAKSVPTTRRGSVWMWRRLGGLGIALFLSAPFVKYMIGARSSLVFPANFAVLLAISVGVSAVSWILFATVRESPSRRSSRRLSLRAHLVHGWRLVHRRTEYRRYIRARLVLGAASSIRPFLIVFASKAWGLSDEVAGTFLAIQLVGQILASVAAGQTSDRIGNRSVFIMSAIAMTLSSGVACLAAFGPWQAPGGLVDPDAAVKVLVLGAAFVGGGFFISSSGIGSSNYMMDIAPDRQRPSYIAFASGFTLPLAVLPAAYGWAADTIGFRLVFLVGFALSLAGLAFSIRLPEPRDDISQEDLEAHR